MLELPPLEYLEGLLEILSLEPVLDEVLLELVEEGDASVLSSQKVTPCHSTFH